jgi:hypothetical protein
MRFVKTFKGYEDKVQQLDAVVNQWIQGNQVQVLDIKTTMSHETEGRAKSGDVLYTVLYKADSPID